MMTHARTLTLGTLLVLSLTACAEDTDNHSDERRGPPPGGPQGMDNDAFHQAMESCISSEGLSRPEPGQQPSSADRQKLDSCLEAQGFTKPAGGPPEHGQR